MLTSHHRQDLMFLSLFIVPFCVYVLICICDPIYVYCSSLCLCFYLCLFPICVDGPFLHLCSYPCVPLCIYVPVSTVPICVSVLIYVCCSCLCLCFYPCQLVLTVSIHPVCVYIPICMDRNIDVNRNTDTDRNHRHRQKPQTQIGA